jgi:hypothetical protein
MHVQIGSKMITREALECEEQGEHNEARRLYEEALSKNVDEWDDKKVNEAEIEVWRVGQGLQRAIFYPSSK